MAADGTFLGILENILPVCLKIRVPRILIDAGPMVAILDRSDANHRACLAALDKIREKLVTVWPAVTEAAYLLGEISNQAQDRLLEMIETEAIGILPLTAQDVPRIRQLMQKYRDLPMDLADAAIVCAAERESITTVFTLDRRDFRLYRPFQIKTFHILP